ncbi:type II secretion system protein N [Stutzerimonas stutzeri]|uniref:Secretion protein n=1 Tax=Stutzerimonas stutzeri KOS6 TaxID=1218352 RepID=A0A061JVU3_STUST|nr:type II secretion system protein N [Stutzerimonas stutzeri]EWC42619.1 secretion protein [Stutzerimonas stutzeri KOS6]
MSLPGKLRNYRQHAPLLASILLLCAFAIYLAAQVEQWLETTRAPVPTDVSGRDFGGMDGPDLQRLEILFGSTAPAGAYAPATAPSDLILRGSFVHLEPQRSSAIIQVEGQPPRLYWRGEELQSGVSLHSVYPDHVELLRNGTVEVLRFPTVSSPTYVPDEPADMPYQDEQPYATPAADDTQQMQQQMDALRQQLEEAVNQPETEPSNDQPMEDD